MSTRGFVGTKVNGVISGNYNHSDSYYDYMGKKVINSYFNKTDIMDLVTDERMNTNANGNYIFLYDGLYCEYGYIHNQDNDTLEIYRGFFNKPQVFKQCFTSYGSKEYYVHLITVIDKKKHTKKEVLKMFKEYDDYIQNDKNADERSYYERKFINVCSYCFTNLPIGKKYCNDECKDKALVEKI